MQKAAMLARPRGLGQDGGASCSLGEQRQPLRVTGGSGPAQLIQQGGGVARAADHQQGGVELLGLRGVGGRVHGGRVWLRQAGFGPDLAA